MSAAVLSQTLDLPATSKISGVEMDLGGECLYVIVEDPQLPQTPEPPVISPSYRNQTVLKFVDWGTQA
jgi:hypothetical protein